ncbi:unnamed protein product [Urochloa decumbens]|uniref:GDSL esterase/lipase n=1 Tax=Urochloa decumbens TaxID=240449 RepID=A0ABC8WL06_9POAL
MALLLLLLLSILLRLAGGAAATASEPSRSPATALFVLGDSTVSCGGSSSSILPLNLTAGPCLFPSAARRRLLPDLLAAKMGLPPPPPISTLNGTAAAAARGVNFGGVQYGGGGIFRTGAALGQQLRLAAETLQLLQLEEGNPQQDASSISGAVFVLSFGADAYARLLARAPGDADAAAPKHGRRGLGRLLADRVARGVQELYEAEVRRVAVIGVPPLGCAPRVMWAGGGGGGGCVEEANELIEGYNARLAARLEDLRPQLPGADVVFCDVYKGMMEIISNPGRYGFEETKEACCGLGPFKATVGCLSKEMACRSPERHVWWDLYTPTDVVANLVTNWSWSWESPMMGICSPISLQHLAAGPPAV